MEKKINSGDVLLQQAAAYLSPTELVVIEQALDVAANAHAGYQRLEGCAYIEHPIAVATILAEWQAPTAVLAAGILHDVGKDRYAHSPTPAALRETFGEEISDLVRAVARLGRLDQVYATPASGPRVDSMEQVARQMPWIAIALQRMPLAVVIKLADRLHNLASLHVLPPERCTEFAERVLSIFVPFAERLGMRDVKRRLEDAAFGVLQPDDLAAMQERYPLQRRAEASVEIVACVARALGEQGIAAEVGLQPASWYELYKRERKRDAFLPLYLAQQVLVVVDELAACYAALGVIHGLWPPQHAGISDYIAVPRPNGYRALHTNLNYESGDMLRVIIREREMQRVAEYGITANWLGVSQNLLPELPPWQDPPPGEVAVFTPNGDLRMLPEGATPIDFAYDLHRNMGHQCIGVRVNGRPVALTHQLANGDVVEILTSRASVGPSPEWLEHVQTPRARTSIRQWLKRQNPGDAARKGMTVLDRLMRREGILFASRQVQTRLQAVAEQLGYESRRDLLVAVGLDQREPEQVLEQLKRPLHRGEVPLSLQATIVSLVSLTDAERHQRLAGCCHPQPPDPIVGYLTSRSEVVIHRTDCSNLAQLKPLIDAQWNTTGTLQHSEIEIVAIDRLGLVRDVSSVFAKMQVLMVSFHADQMSDGSARIRIGLGELSGSQIEKLLERLRAVPDVREAKVRAPQHSPHAYRGSIAEQRFRNPYTLTPATGDAFFGREEELRILFNDLRDVVPGRALLLWGPRRIGKTSLLLRFKEYLGGVDYLVAFVDMQRLSHSSTLAFLHAIIKAIVEALDEPSARLPKLSRMRRDPLTYFRSFVENVPGLQKRQLVVILDEFQLLSTLREEGARLEDINHYFRSLIQHRSGLSIVFSGGGILETLLQLPQTSFMLEVARMQKISTLKESDARRLVVEPVQHLHYAPEAVDWIVELTGCHPYYLQWLCSEIVSQAGRQQQMNVTDVQVDRVLTDVLPDQGEQVFSHLWGSSSNVGLRHQQWNRLVLTAISASAGTGRWVTPEQVAVAGTAEILDESQLWNTLQDLERMDTLQAVNGRYRIRIALFEYWLKAHYTVDGLVKDIKWRW